MASPLEELLADAREEGAEQGRRHALAVARRHPRVLVTRLPEALTTEPPVDEVEAVELRGEGMARALREMWWLMDVEGGDV